MKPLFFLGSSLVNLTAFPTEAKRAAGFQLRRVQAGFEPVDWKPLVSVGPGAMEIRIHAQGEWRVLYVAKFRDSVYVLHAFQKKTQKTPQTDIELARKRYREVAP